MNTFNPWEPAILHEKTCDRIQTWTGEDAADYLTNSALMPDGSVKWRDFIFDGWGNVLGG